MNELQKRLLELLKEIDSICKKHNITYYIDGGSAIGAIRHRGFIPWDDDIDIVMTRENFNKFEKVIDDEIPENRKYESIERNKKYSMVYARYCDKTTTSILRTSMLDVFESGVFIDIFILDPIPNGEKFKEKYLKTFRAYAEYINPYYYEEVISGNNSEMFKMRVLRKLLGKKGLHKYINKKLFSYKEGVGDYYAFRFDLFPFIYKKEFFKEPRYMQFEDFLAPVPTEIEDYLQVHYGDTWMYIPNHDNQEVHNVVTNLNVPYQKFKNDYMRYIKKGTLRKYKEFHKLRIQHYNSKQKVNKGIYELNAIRDNITINKKLSNFDIKNLYNKKKYSLLYDLFQEYFSCQLNKNYLTYKIVIDIGNNDYYALQILTIYGFYYKVKKMLKVLNNKYPEIEENVNIIDKLNVSYYKNDFDTYFELINKYYDKYNNVLDFIRGKVKLLIHEKDYEQANKLINAGLNRFKDDHFLLKYQADILMTKDKKEALNLYNKVLDITNNGILILEIKDIIGGK